MTPDQIIDKLKTIRNLCDAPHWTIDRRDSIRAIADGLINTIMHDEMIASACEAQEKFTADELEQFAAKKQNKNQTK